MFQQPFTFYTDPFAFFSAAVLSSGIREFSINLQHLKRLYAGEVPDISAICSNMIDNTAADARQQSSNNIDSRYWNCSSYGTTNTKQNTSNYYALRGDYNSLSACVSSSCITISGATRG